MLNCKETSQLVSQSLDKNLDFSTRLKVNFHLIMCKFCRRFNTQIQAIERIFKNVTTEEIIDFEASDMQMPEDAKIQIKAALKKSYI